MTDTIYAALSKAQAEMTHAQLDANNPHFKSKYATLQSIIDAVRPALTKHGLAFVQKSIDGDPGAVVVETIIYHSSGEHICCGPVRVPVDKANAHGIGSALTYAKRYSLAMACGISADEDDDGNAAVSAAPKQQETISAEQAQEIKAKLQETNSDTIKFLQAIGNAKSVDAMPKSAYAMAVKLLEKKQRAMSDATAE